MIHTQPLDGYTYLGLFRMLFARAVECRGCWETATAVLVIIGCGDIHTLPVCGSCGPPLDEKLQTYGLRKPIPRPARVPVERRKRIAAAKGTTWDVAARFGVNQKTVRQYRRDYSNPA